MLPQRLAWRAFVGTSHFESPVLVAEGARVEEHCATSYANSDPQMNELHRPFSFSLCNSHLLSALRITATDWGYCRLHFLCHAPDFAGLEEINAQYAENIRLSGTAANVRFWTAA
jgi:hypothetical protein